MIDNKNLEKAPLGFGLALAQNSASLNRFSALSELQQKEIINRTRSFTTKEEMREYVNNIAKL